MQATTFPVEIFIHDDGSRDGTQAIIQEYANRYPHLFRIVLQKKNQVSKAARRRWLGSRKMFAPGAYITSLKGEFVACCEGDDFWIDSLKLEHQIRFLLEQPETAGTFHRCVIVDLSKRPIAHPWDSIQYKKSYSQGDCLLALRSAYPTASLVFRKAALREGNFPAYYRKTPCDHTLDVLITESGTLDFMDFTGSCYRQHDGGIWSSAHPKKQHSMLTNRLLAFLGDRNLTEFYGETLETQLFNSYGYLWWSHYKGGLRSWLTTFCRILILFPAPGNVVRFLKYSVTKNSVVRFTLADLLRGTTIPNQST